MNSLFVLLNFVLFLFFKESDLLILLFDSIPVLKEIKMNK